MEGKGAFVSLPLVRSKKQPDADLSDMAPLAAVLPRGAPPHGFCRLAYRPMFAGQIVAAGSSKPKRSPR
jgi:hypothetical protein